MKTTIKKEEIFSEKPHAEENCDLEEEKKENGSQNPEGSNSRVSDGDELNSNDDISEPGDFETKNTLYCYYEKVRRFHIIVDKFICEGQ